MSKFLEKFISKDYFLSKSKSKTKISERLSHLYLNGRRLEEIGDLSPCMKLKVLYLHNNKISKIENVNGLVYLTHLYLQWNNIKKIENLDCLRNLKKLYLGYNEITRLENIEHLTNLEELHLERQIIDENVEFTFDSMSIRGIARSLAHLNITKLNLKSLEPISYLFRLKTLAASENKFEDSKALGASLGRMPFLESAILHSCPAQKDIRYRENITTGANSLMYLDDKQITPTIRTFMKRFEELKDKKSKSNISAKRIGLEKIAYTTPANKERMKSIFILSQDGQEMGYKTWNSLNFIQKPKRIVCKKKEHTRPAAVCPLQGRNIH